MENIMLQDEKKEFIKIVDFGLGNIYDDVNPLKTQCGSPEYAAPELFIRGRKYGPEVDLWSLGVILYVMGAGRLPFHIPHDGAVSVAERRRRLLWQICRGLSAAQERALGRLSAEYRDLLRRLLTPAEHRRICARELCRHPWIAAGPQSRAVLLQAATESRMDEEDHRAIMNELVSFTNLNRREVEMDIINRRFGNFGGMYNIMAHEKQRRGLIYNFKMYRSTDMQTLEQNFSKLQLNSNNFRVEKIETSAKPLIKDKISNKTKLNDELSIAKYDFGSKKILRPLSFRDNHSMRETKNANEDRIKSCSRNMGSVKKKDERPMTTSCSKHISFHSPLLDRTLRPLSELSKQTSQKEQLIVRSATQGPRPPRGSSTLSPWQSRCDRSFVATSLKSPKAEPNAKRTLSLRREAGVPKLPSEKETKESQAMKKPTSLIKCLDRARRSLKKCDLI